MSTPIVDARAKLLERKFLADTVYEFTFEMVDPTEIDFDAGQYIALEIDKKTRRQYSISNSPLKSKNIFEIVLDIKPDGLGTKYLMSLKPGDEIKFIGQIGMFTLPEDLAENLFFVCTGVGLAPLKSMIDTLIEEGLNAYHNIFVYYGTRYEGDIFYDKEFNEYFNNGKIHDYRIFLSRANIPGTIEGYVTQFIEMHDVEVLQDSQIFLCGSGAMIHDVREELIKRNVPSNSIIYEKFYN